MQDRVHMKREQPHSAATERKKRLISNSEDLPIVQILYVG